MEPLPLEKFKELQVKKFRSILKWAYERSKFHRKLYQEAGLKPGDIKVQNDILVMPNLFRHLL
jgi:phenylacetate-CoA ligase